MFVVTLPKSAVQDPHVFSLKAKKAGADLLEVLGDLTPNLPSFTSALPILASPRRKDPVMPARLNAAWTDLEKGENAELPPETTLIHSFHDFEKTPSLPELQNIVSALEKDGTACIKIATFIRSFADLLTLQELDASLSSKKRVILGMGPKAHLSRILSPLRNILTYTFLDGEEETAPGQVPLSLHLLTVHCRHPRIFGLLAGPEVKSFSPLIHNTLFSLHGIDAVYSVFPTDNLDGEWENLRALGVEGLSVTTPWKHDIVSKLTHLDPEGERLQAVNTVLRERDGSWKGYPLDVEGLLAGYPFLSDISSVAILGSGGVVPSVIAACERAGIKDIRIFARNEHARNALCRNFPVHGYPLEEISVFQGDLIVYAIPEDIPLVLPQAPAGARALDLRYGRETLFLREASAKGYHSSDGLPMLLHQALAQFRLFTGITPGEADIKVLHQLLLSTSSR